MDELMKHLLQLQELDRDLHRVEGELQSLPKELAGRDGEIKKHRESLAANKDATKKAQVEAKNLEGEIKSREEKIAKLDGETNKVRDNAQLLAIQHQIKTLRDEIGQFEDQVLALFSKVETLEEESKARQKDLQQAEEEFARFKKNVDAELAARSQERSELKKKREQLVPQLKADVYEKYTRILAVRDGRAMAGVDGQICQGCYMEVVANDFVKLLNGKEMVTCRHCNRILYIPIENKA